MFRRSVPSLRQLSQSNRLLSSVSAADAEHSAAAAAPGAFPATVATASREVPPAKALRAQPSGLKELKSPKINDVFAAPASCSRLRKEYRSQLKRLEDLPNQQTIRGCHRLVDLRTAMDLYRKVIASTKEQRTENCSPLVHMILSSMRLREIVFRPLIYKLKTCLKSDQDAMLRTYLEQLITDIVEKRARVSAYGVVWILQSLETLGSRPAATAAWYSLQKAADAETEADKLIIENAPNPQRAKAEISREYRLRTVLDAPAAIGAAINCADHATLDVAKAQAMYDAYHARTNTYDCVLDDAMTRYLLEEGDYELALSLYLSMLERHDPHEFEGTLARLNNQLLADVTNVDYAEAIFRNAVSAGSMNRRLHPASVSAFLKRYYEQTKDLDGVLTRYESALRAIRDTYYTEGDELSVQILRKQVMECITNAFQNDAAQGTAKLREVVVLEQQLFNVSTVAANTALSCTYRRWPGESKQIYEMAENVLAHETVETPLGIDSLRTLLCAAEHSTDISNEMVDQWVEALAVCCRDEFTFYDLRAFVCACVGSKVYDMRKDLLYSKAAGLLDRKAFNLSLINRVKNSMYAEGTPERVQQLIEALPLEASAAGPASDAATEKEVMMREGHKHSNPSRFKSKRRRSPERHSARTE